MPPLATAHLFFAQTTAPHASLDAANPVVFLGLLIGAALTILTVIDKVDGMVQRRKRVPTLEAEFARKEALDALESRLNADITALQTSVDTTSQKLDDKLDAVANSMNKEFRDLYRALGIAEGKLEKK